MSLAGCLGWSLSCSMLQTQVHRGGLVLRLSPFNIRLRRLTNNLKGSGTTTTMAMKNDDELTKTWKELPNSECNHIMSGTAGR